jgi:hypothetical protein
MKGDNVFVHSPCRRKQTPRFRFIFFLLFQSLALALVPFHRFAFAPNNVCVKPKSFHAFQKLENGTSKTLEFTMRNVPGDGDCMFLAVSLATCTSYGLGGNYALLRAISNETRDVVAQILSVDKGNLHVEGKRIVRVSDLLKSAARNEKVSETDYVNMIRNGTLQGGGPELTVLSNVLRRPISIYEIDTSDTSFVKSWNRDDDNEKDVPNICPIKCVGSFGEVFQDPCLDIPQSAILQNMQAGAFSWHIHVLVVDSGNGEKHACALLPKVCYF